MAEHYGNLDEAREHLPEWLEADPRHPDSFFCPFCGSGHGPRRSGALRVKRMGGALRFHCFSCGRFGDVLDVIACVRGCTQREAVRIALEMYGNGSASTVPKRTEARREASEPVEPPPNDFSLEVQRFASSLLGASVAVEYLRGRGITLDTAKRFKLGCDEKRGMLVIPYSPSCTYYSMRSLKPDGGHFNLEGVRVPLFNPGALYAGGPCFIVESPLCAISICQAGGSASAISGTSGGGRLMAQVKKRKPSGVLLLALDMDEPGRRAQAEIADALTAAGVPFADGSSVIGSGAKDPNEALQADPEGFATRVALLIAKYQG